ncbi:MAG: ribonuclease P [Crenarchaeota archaeon]|nr:ribonuclease P [Thermoproteota archaeon]
MSSETKQIAKQRINVLFELAEANYKTNPQIARRYIEIARKIAMSARLGLPTIYTRKICKKCHSFLFPGETSRVRTKSRREPHIVITCLNCGNQKRIPLKPKLKLKNEQEKIKNE